MKINTRLLHPSELEEYDADTFIRKIRLDLYKHFVSLWPSHDYLDFCQAVRKILREKKITPKLIVGCWTRSRKPICGNKSLEISLEPTDLTINFCCSLMQLFTAVDYIAVNKSDKANIVLVNAVYHLGFVEGYLTTVNDAANVVKGPIKGGQSLSNKRRDVEMKLISLLDRSKEDKWKSEKHVISEINQPFTEYVESHGYSSIVKDPADYILNEIAKKGATKDAYLANKKPVKERSR